MSTHNSFELRDVLAGKAAELGFEMFGVTSAVSDPDDRDRLYQWLAYGFHASMAWMARNAERRTDLQQVLPGAKSVISVALNYYHPQKHNECCGELKVSRYAWGDDYHDIVGAKLEALKEALDQLVPESKSLTYVDTGPVMEKAIAQRAGIGWIGKNACLITRDYGSWVFLGEIITTAELPVDQPHTDFCGSCSRCIEACPTDAFPEPYFLDASKCISYWTIEHRGDDIPRELSSHFDGWIFGCDICQDVCPWNRFAKASEVGGFAPRPESLSPKVPELTGLSEDEFRKRYTGSPILRARAEGLRRNAESQSDDLLGSVTRSARADKPFSPSPCPG